jgi:hypothetical protein
MKKSYVTVALAVICIFGLGISSRAQDTDGIVVTVPFDFVVAGKALPAGNYHIGRYFNDPHSGVVLRSGANTAVVLPTTVEGASVPKALLTFQHSGEKYFLGKIETPGSVYTIATPRPRLTVARANDQPTVSVSGTN